MAEWIGRTLSKVKIERQIGRGGMAEVYLGRHTTLDRPVAVKILHAHLSEDTGLMARFRREAQAVAAMRHQNIVTVLDFDIVDGRPYIVMELLEGQSLADYLNALHAAGHSLPLPGILRLVQGIAAALDYAHARGIVHRDVKPANVMIRRGETPLDPRFPLPADAEPVLTDFGVAHMAGTVTQTASGTVLGTPAYMSPEQVRGEQVDGRSDVYSLGIIVYEMLAGRLPFDGENTTPASILVKHINAEPPPIPNTAPSIQAVVSRALAKQAGDRYPTAGAFVADLAHTVGLPHSTPTTIAAARAAPPTALQPDAPRRRRPGLLRIAALIVLGAAALLLGTLALGSLFETDSAGQPTAAQAAVPPGLSSGESTQAGSEAGPLDSDALVCAQAAIQDSAVGISLTLAPSPPDTVYAAWLASAEQEPLPLGVFADTGGGPTLTFQDPAGRNLLQVYDRIDLAPLAPGAAPALPASVPCSGLVDAGLLTALRALGSVAEGQPYASALLDGIESQTAHFASHQGFAVTAITNNDLAGGKAHSEHLINIIEGENGAMYGDWNGDGLVQNPGDGYGLEAYLTTTLALLGENADEALVAQLNALIGIVDDGRELARQISTADEISAVTGLTQELAGLDVVTPGADLIASLAGRAFPVRLDLLSTGD